MTQEKQIALNVQEIGVILSALQELDHLTKTSLPKHTAVLHHSTTD